MVLTSNQSFGAWGEVFGDRVIATAILDRLMQHMHRITLEGDSLRRRGEAFTDHHGGRQQPLKLTSNVQSPQRTPRSR